MRICVTKKDIANGVIADCRKCPVALAIKRRIPDRIIQVFQLSIQIWRTGGPCEMDIIPPPKVTEFIRAFDWEVSGQGRKPVKPLTFDLPI